VIYIGGQKGGVYRSVNGGISWKSLNGPKQGRWIFKAYVPVTAIDVDPVDPGIVYVGTENSGIWKKSNDKDWEKIREGFKSMWGSKVDVLKASPNKLGIIYASGHWIEQFDYLQPWGVLRSIDGGASWQEKWAKGIITDIGIGGKDKETVYVASRSYGAKVPLVGITESTVITVPVLADGVFRYTGNGKWSDISNWIDSCGIKGRNPLPQYSPVSIAVNPKFPNMVFTAFRNDGIYYSPNFGNDWYSIGLKDQGIEKIFFSSEGDSSILYVYTPKNLFRLQLSNTANIVKPHSPVDIMVWDSEGRGTGLANGTIKEEIPNSIYDNGSKTVTIFSPNDTYLYEIVGIANGSYGLSVVQVEGGNVNSFAVTNVSTTNKTTYQYTINWSTHEATVQIDSDGDGVFEQNVTLLQPVPSFTYTPLNPVVNQAITFNASSSYDPDGNITNYEWNFGDGTNGSGNIITHSYSSAGKYSVTLTITDNSNTLNSTTKIITIPDTTPPESITNLTNTTGQTWINWTWTNPPDVDFNYTMIYLNGVWQLNTSNPFYNVSSLIPDTYYEISMHTVDKVGNINTTWVNQTTKTQAPFFKEISDHGVDIDSDGLYNYLTVDANVNIVTTETYTVEGALYDSNGSEISENENSTYLDTGEHSVILNFNGYTIFKHKVAGPYLVNLKLKDKEGNLLDTKNHTTLAYNYTNFQHLVALTGYYSDYGTDINNDGIFDFLTIDVGVFMAKPGYCFIKARLMDVNGEEIVWAENTTWLDAGEQIIQLHFNGTTIYEHGVDGPYYLRDVYVYHTGDPTQSDYVYETYTTKAYSYLDFGEKQPPIANANGPYTGTEGQPLVSCQFSIVG